MSLRNIRRIYSVFFFLLFFVLLFITDFRHMKGYEVSLFLELDPLVATGTFLSSWTVYRGLVLSIIIVAGTLVFGRFFCSWICPFGILNQWIGHLLNRKRPVDDYRINAYRPLFRLKYYILTALLVMAAFGVLQGGLLDPIPLITRSFAVSVLPAADVAGAGIHSGRVSFHGATVIAVVFVILMFANRFIVRFWCRALCPLGALLGLLSHASILRIRRDVSKCNDCGKCLRYCHGACDPNTELRVSECVLCMNCISDCPEGAIHYGTAGEKSSVHQPVDINRRRLIETAVAGIVLVPMIKSVASARSVVQPGAVRPPGSLREEDFLRRCIKCGQCMRVCPTNAIQPALLETGFEGLWSPVLINRIGYCEFNCVLCGQVCPTGAIRPLTVEQKTGRPPFKEPVRIGTAFYDRGRCLPWAMNIECIVCEEVCPTSPKAIWFETKKLTLRDGRTKTLKLPHLDPKLCVGCGICENKCPVHDRAAIRVTSIGETRSASNRLLLSAVARHTYEV